MKVSVEKPGSPDEVLAHFGKKGMRWGVRSRRTAEIKSARRNLNVKAAQYHATKDKGKKKSLKRAYLKNPDRATALRMTRGEKAVNALVLGLAAPTFPGIAAIGVGVVGAQVGTRKAIERKQARGGYN